jgi:uncharacterized protein
MGRRRIAVVGSGVAGLTAAHILQRAADVTLYDADGRLGGHADTHEVLDPAGRPLAIDTGFIVHNDRTYPHLTRLFAELGVQTQASEMSMSVRCDGCGLEYAGARGPAGLFPSRSTATNTRYLRLLTDIPRFHRAARAVLAEPAEGARDETLDAFLTRGRFGHYTRSHFVTPLVSAVWSCAPNLAGQYPARYLFEFLANHGMLSLSGSPQWRTVVGGSGRYVAAVAKRLSAVNLSTPVRAVTRVADGVEVRDEDDGAVRFDGVVVATHPGQALSLLARPTRAEAEALGAWRYSVNHTVLHTDPSVLPHAPRARASWNYHLPSCDVSAGAVRVSYDLTRLQRLGTDTRYLVSLGAEGTVRPDAVVAEMAYEHPLFTPASVAAQSRLPGLNDGRVAFAGAYHGWGFHEDGARSGVAAAASLGVSW